MTAGLSPDALGDTTRVCVDLDLGMHTQDASIREVTGEGPPGSDGDYGEDYGRISNPGAFPAQIEYIDYPFPAQRWLVRVTNEDTGLPIWGFAPLDADGCTTGPDPDVPYHLAYEIGQTFKVEFVRWAEYGNRRIVAYDCDNKAAICEFGRPGDNAMTLGGTPIFSGITPSDAADTHVTVTPYVTPPSDVVDYDILSPSDHVLWATSFAEETAPVRPTQAFSVYAGHAYNELVDDVPQIDVLGSLSRAGLQFGGQPSVALVHGNYRSKFLCAHEYGHVQTAILAEIPTTESDYSYDGDEGTPGTHYWTGASWQSAAVAEGFADYYATWVFNDVSTGSVFAQPGDNQSYDVPGGPICDDPIHFDCTPGVASEADWASALHKMANQSSLEPREVCLMLEAAYSSTWEGVGTATGAFWTDFQARMATHLKPPEFEMADYATWTSVAATCNIDQ